MASAVSPDWLRSTTAADAAQNRGVMSEFVRPLSPPQRIIGTATTIEVSATDNRFPRELLARGAFGGPVLVVGGADHADVAVMGDLVATALANLGFHAVVTAGLVRDRAGIRDVPIKVWCRGVRPAGPLIEGPGRVGHPTICGGVIVNTGDLIIADDDGVVVWPSADVEALMTKARHKEQSDRERAERLSKGG